MSKIQIIVAGAAGVGKSTIAERITELLLQDGFDVDHVPMEELSAQHYEPVCSLARLESVKERAEVTVTEKQAPRPNPLERGECVGTI